MVSSCGKQLVKQVLPDKNDVSSDSLDGAGDGDIRTDVPDGGTVDSDQAAPPDIEGKDEGESDQDYMGSELDLPLEETVPQAEYEICAKGGTFVYDSGVILVVPASAVTDCVDVKVSSSSTEAPGSVKPVTQVWDFEPSGYLFDLPVIARLPIIENDLDEDQWPMVVGFVEDDGGFVEVSALPDPVVGLVSVQTSHFSAVLAGLKDTSGGCLTYELCNGKDDDCDGKTDEEPDTSDFSCPHVGVCFGGFVKEECLDGVWQCDFSGLEGNADFEPDGETKCDGKDNDCDGQTDEGIHGTIEELALMGQEPNCKIDGICAGATVKAACYSKQKFICDYSLVDGYQGVAELTCDQIDNDCDGLTDEGTCGVLEDCEEDVACADGHCALPLGGEDKMFCTEKSDSCLVVSDVAGEEGALLELLNGDKWCIGTGDESAVIECAAGEWGEPFLCIDEEAINPTCDPVTKDCTGGCAVDDDCDDDGIKCNGDEACVKEGAEPFGTCLVVTIPTCSIPDTCAKYECVEAPGTEEEWECAMIPINEGNPCDDKDLCTGGGKCEEGVCAKGDQIVCDDGNPCTVGTCEDETGECLFGVGDLVGAPCDDANACTTNDVCQEDETCDGVAKFCDDSNPCTENDCIAETGECDFPITPSVECEDNDFCTLPGICSEVGECVTEPVDCDDFNDCTLDECVPISGECEHTPGEPALTCIYPSSELGVQDICIPLGVCSEAGICDPGEDFCECHTDEDCLAQDEDLCDGLTKCELQDGLLACVPILGSVVECDPSDNSQCLVNACEPATGDCGMTPLSDGTICSDGDACTLGDGCLTGECVGDTPLVCDDKNACTVDSCDAVGGCQFVPAVEGTFCQDGDPCTLSDACNQSGTCVSGPQKDPPCLDEDVCTFDSCTEDGSECLFEPIPGCCAGDEDCIEEAGEVCFEMSCCQSVCADDEIGQYECGDDQCGGQCGQCGGGPVCYQHNCCTANCEVPPKECGNDGCGGSCGECMPGSVCTGNYECCQPDCFGKDCGADGCGGTCGECSVGFICNVGVGMCEECIAHCEGAECGPDGCGGSCGECQLEEVCLDDGFCCTPQCQGLLCGDDGCGGSCGECGWWEACDDGECVCDLCCAVTDDCGPTQTCTGEAGEGEPFSVCEEQLSLFFEGFETQEEHVGQPSPTFTNSWTSGKPWTVKFGDYGYSAHTGNYSYRYYKVGGFSGYFWRDVMLAEVAEGETMLLSFFARCSLSDDKAAFTLEASVGGQLFQSFTNADCDKQWHRYYADISSVGSGKAEVRFKLQKSSQVANEILLDDIAILSTKCPDHLVCADYEETGGVCELESIDTDHCYIGLVCFEAGTIHEEIECAVCKPSDYDTAWTPDGSLCDDGDPLTPDICNLKDDPKGCYNGG